MDKMKVRDAVQAALRNRKLSETQQADSDKASVLSKKLLPMAGASEQREFACIREALKAVGDVGCKEGGVVVLLSSTRAVWLEIPLDREEPGCIEYPVIDVRVKRKG